MHRPITSVSTSRRSFSVMLSAWSTSLARTVSKKEALASDGGGSIRSTTTGTNDGEWNEGADLILRRCLNLLLYNPTISALILQLIMSISPSDRSVSRGRDPYVRENHNLTFLLTHRPITVIIWKRGRRQHSSNPIHFSRCQTRRWP